MADRYSLDFSTRTVSGGARGRAAVSAAARGHTHAQGEVEGLETRLVALESAVANLQTDVDDLQSISGKVYNEALGTWHTLRVRVNAEGIQELYLAD